ncbi:MAG TPA: type II secretion system F family protein [Dermatophilaceae bacterium]|nr:type II secretion system F family protein [Dermatophilaceae bacterium]
MIAAMCLALAILLLPGRLATRPDLGLGLREARHPVKPDLAAPPDRPLPRDPWLQRLVPPWSRQVPRRRLPHPLRWLRRARSQDRATVVDAVLDILDVLGSALRAGQSPERAVRYAVASAPGPWGGGAAPDDVIGGLERLAEEHGIPALAHVTRAWRLAAESGAPLASAVDVGADLLRHERAHEQALAVAFAGPRATIRLLTALPLAGPLVGMTLGLDPLQMYLLSPVGQACLGTGIVLVVVGRLWCRRLLARAMGAGSS